MKRTLAVCLSLALVSLPLAAQYPGPPPPPPQQQDAWGYRGGDPGNWDRSWNSRPFPRSGACFFTDRNFGGNRFCVRSGDRLQRLPGNFGDNISSIQVFGRGTAQVFDDRNYQGVNFQFRRSVADLRNVASKPGHTWNNRISSVAVY